MPWLGALLIIAWLGRYDGNPTKVFGLTLVATQPSGEWWDLLAVAGDEPDHLLLGRATAMPVDKVQAAVAEVESEASIELESHLVT